MHLYEKIGAKKLQEAASTSTLSPRDYKFTLIGKNQAENRMEDMKKTFDRNMGLGGAECRTDENLTGSGLQ